LTLAQVIDVEIDRESKARLSLDARVSCRARLFDDIDFSAAQTLRSVCELLKTRGIRLVFVMVSDEVKAELDRYGLSALVGEEAFFASGDDLISAYQNAS
jgi:MFS superfamily sulfate permease-like transporter